MADTLQVVKWALERSCPMRYGDNWTDPKVVHEQLSDISRYDFAVTNDQVLGDVCVYVESIKPKPPTFWGFLISHSLANFGGVQVIEINCHGCEANVQWNENNEQGLAGCYGHFYMYANNEQIQRAVKKAGLQPQFLEVFLPTNPLWYGFWADSPLTIAQCKTLLSLIPNLPVDESDKNSIDRFLAALETAVKHNLKLHVALAPPGHVDLGWRTVYHHCPRCKVWLEPSKIASLCVYCQVCGFQFNPKDTSSSWREDIEDLFGKSLDEQLDKDHYEDFIWRYLEHRGYSQLEIEEILAPTPPTDEERVRTLVDSYNNDEIAQILNQEGRKTRRGKPYTKADVHNLCRRYKIQRSSN
jgi:hypothetical protein